MIHAFIHTPLSLKHTTEYTWQSTSTRNRQACPVQVRYEHLLTASNVLATRLRTGHYVLTGPSTLMRKEAFSTLARERRA